MRHLSVFLTILTVILALLFMPVLFKTGSITANAGDIYQHYYPLKYQVAEQLMTGRMPLWNPYIFNGQPLLANPQSAVFYPLSLLFPLFALPPAFTWFMFLHLLLGGVFFYLLLHRLGSGRSAALFASLAFVLSSFLVYKVPAGHPVALSGYIWLPAVLLSLEAMRRSPASVYAAAFGGLVLAFQFLSGHTFPFYISLVCIVLHLAWHRFSYAKALGIAAGVSLALSSVQLIPGLELARSAETSNWPSLARAYSLPPHALLTALLPGRFGSPVSGDFIRPDTPSFFYELYCLYFGLVPLLFALYGAVTAFRTKRPFFPLLAVIGLVLSLGFFTPLYPLLYDRLPGMGLLRVPARFYYITLVSLCVCAAWGWGTLLRRTAVPVKLLVLLVAVVELLSWNGRFIAAQDLSAYRRPNPLSGMLSPLYRIITDPREVAANKAMLYHHYNVNGYEAVFLKDFTRYVGLQEKQAMGTTGLVRVDLDSPLARGLSAAYALTADPVPGYTPVRQLSARLTVYRIPRPLPRVYLAQTARVISDRNVYDQIEYLRKTTLTPAAEIVVTKIPRGFPAVSAGGKLVSFDAEPGRLLAGIVLPSPGIVVFSDLFYPGWRAAAGSLRLPLHRGDKVFPVIFAPAGDYTGANRIILYFDPSSWRTGLYITLAALLAGGLLLLYRGRFTGLG